TIAKWLDLVESGLPDSSVETPVATLTATGVAADSGTALDPPPADEVVDEDDFDESELVDDEEYDDLMADESYDEEPDAAAEEQFGFPQIDVTAPVAPQPGASGDATDTPSEDPPKKKVDWRSRAKKLSE
ncbi:MAG: hypothetical protein O2983_03450, partial [Planctomycetota bacterium]|nr:hypothetical protein [Planctomycetota bacterium]